MNGESYSVEVLRKASAETQIKTMEAWFRERLARALLKDIWPLLPAQDHIRPVIDSTFPLKDARLAHERMESGANIGKIVLICDAGDNVKYGNGQNG